MLKILETEDELVLTDIESDAIINNLKDELITESILDQIKNTLVTNENTDFLQIFKDRYNFLRETYKDSPNFIKKLDETRDIMNCKIFNAIVEKFDIKYTENTFNINDYTDDLYNFFVLNYKENIIDYLESKIEINKKSLVMSLNDPKYLKNINVNSLKKVLKNRDDAIIIANIQEVINSILNQDFDNLDIIKDICNLDIEEVTNYKIYQYFLEDFTLTLGNDFFKIFFSIILNKEVNYSSIINEVRLYLMKTAPKK